jgi:N-acetylated-alpha-linked acidic dipeptidase
VKEVFGTGTFPAEVAADADDDMLSIMDRPAGVVLHLRSATIIALLAAAVVTLTAGPSAAAGDPDPLRFWRPERRAEERAAESALLGLVDARSLRGFHDLVAREPHVAGTPGDARLIEALARAHREQGLEVETHEVFLYLPRPLRAELEIVAPLRRRLALKEDVLREDSWSGHPDIDPGWNAWSASGEATGRVVYANQGTRDDFARLRALGVDVHGALVLARYGGNFRGYKARFAEEAGAAGLLIYTDPADGGYVDGPAYPEGGWANASQIQRGSLLTLPYQGDVLTPFLPAAKDAERLDPETVPLPKIPVQPIGFRAAQEILSRMTGAPVPKGWQGGLPFTYRLTGGDALRVRLRVEQERRIRRTANVIATLKGKRFPDQKVILGSHHDAWTFGAADPGAGTIVVLEAARAFAEAAHRGSPPDRTLVFAHWGAEEFGLMGSTEWVESRPQELRKGTVAYVNLDAASLGLELGASASPSLKELVADVAAAVPQPGGAAGESVLQAWTARGVDPDRPGRPAMGDLGGGSDHVAFLCHLGIASLGLSARGSQGTSYHSAYDDLAWYRKVVGDDYRSARLVTQVTALLAARLANADILPLDAAAYGMDARRHAEAIVDRARRRGLPAELGRLDAAALRFERRARALREGWLADLEAGRLGALDLARINARLLRADRLWALPAGLPGRPWYRNVFVAPDDDSGYDSWLLPLLRAPLEQGDGLALLRAEEPYLDLLGRLDEQVAAPLGLDARVRQATAGFPAKVSLFAKNLDTGESWGLLPDERVRTASTIKIPILVEAYAQVAEGRHRWDEPITLTAEGKVGGAGILGEFAPGLTLTLRDAANLMIAVSDNTATNLVLDKVTAEAVNARMDTLGFPATRSLRKIGGGGASRAAEDPANRRFGLGVSTSREMVSLLEKIERGEVVSPEASREMIELLKRQQFRDGIGRRVTEVPRAVKPGALDRLRSDVGIFYTERGRVAMAITVDELPETVWTVDNPGYLLLSRLSDILLDELGRPEP